MSDDARPTEPGGALARETSAAVAAPPAPAILAAGWTRSTEPADETARPRPPAPNPGETRCAHCAHGACPQVQEAPTDSSQDAPTGPVEEAPTQVEKGPGDQAAPPSDGADLPGAQERESGPADPKPRALENDGSDHADDAATADGDGDGDDSDDSRDGDGGDGGGDDGGGDQPDRDNAGPPTLVIRYGAMHNIGEFRHNFDRPVLPGAKVVIRTDRGVELGEALIEVCDRGGYGACSRAELRSFCRSNGADYPLRRAGRCIRLATEQDVSEQRHLDQQAREEAQYCAAQVKELGLRMKVVTVEHLLGGERIVFYFAAENRVDFRQLVKRLAGQFRTRIEMRQVGARDEARLVGDYERCGQRCCCQQFLKELRPVSMRMAKLQKATLDPTKISGRCGRLMCCLRYEDDGYRELKTRLPRKNTWVRTEELVGRVVDGQVLTQLVRLSLPDGTFAAVGVDEIVERNVEPPEPGQAPAGGGGGNARRSSGRRSQGPSLPSTGGEGAEATGQPATDSPAEPAEAPAETPTDAGAEPGGQQAPDGQGDSASGKAKRRRRRRKKKPGQDGGSGGQGGGDAKASGGSGGGGGSSGNKKKRRRRRRKKKPGQGGGSGASGGSSGGGSNNSGRGDG